MEIQTHIQGNFKIVKGFVCIPALAEPDLLLTIQSLNLSPTYAVCIHLNSASTNTQAHILNLTTFNTLKNWATANSNLPVYIILNNHLAPATVGNARKYIMDKAAQLASNSNVFLACLDADCTVNPNYLHSIKTYFAQNPQIKAASINFWHQTSNTDLTNPIVLYETHLRYLKLALQYSGFPFYYHTIGSSMVCTVNAYTKTGGMNTKAAAEDFYFLQKIMPLGFGEIWDTCVFPSSRISNRVPFGTGKAMEKALNNELDKTWYPFFVFLKIKDLFKLIQIQLLKPLQSNWTVNSSCFIVQTFIETKKWETTWDAISKNSTTTKSRNKKWHEFISGNMVFLLCNQLRNAHTEETNPQKEIELLFSAFNYTPNNNSIRENLLLLEKQVSICFLPL